MVSMKDYADKTREESNEHADIHAPEPDFQEGFELGCCPFCHNEDVVVYFKAKPYGQKAYHSCPVCEKAWLIEIDHQNKSISAAEIEWSMEHSELPE